MKRRASSWKWVGYLGAWMVGVSLCWGAQGEPPAGEEEPVDEMEEILPPPGFPALDDLELLPAEPTELEAAAPGGSSPGIGARSIPGVGSGGMAPGAGVTPRAGDVLPVAPVGDGNGGIRMNFQGASLVDVLNYLSEAAGFVIVQEAEVSGTVNIISHRAVSEEEAVELLNAVLIDRGYTALRTGRILRIVGRDEAIRRDLPVRSGADPALIPRRDEMVTQIIPVRYADASRLIENIRPLLDEKAALTANESSNAIVITDTQTNIRRMAEIIRALDTSIASISVIRVFPLDYADATKVAEVIREVFSPTQSAQRGAGAAQAMRNVMEERFRMAAGGAAGRTGTTGTGTSEARQAASRVVAVADEFTNSLVVSAPDELMATIEQIVEQLDTNIAELTEVRVFRLEHADATELAALVNELYVDTATTGQTGRQTGGGPGAFFRGNAANTQRSQRSLIQSRVMAVGDPRTNSLIVSAARDTMMTIAEMVGRLDGSSDKKQRVFVVPLEHADVDNVADILRGMFETGTTAGGSRGTTRTTGTTTSRLTERSTTGATTGTSSLQTGRTTGGGGR
jgi:type II secretory pathway component GspD/PulD (secretin)